MFFKMSHIKFVLSLLCLALVAMRTVDACRCIGLPPPAYCRVDWLAVLKITGKIIRHQAFNQII